MIPSDPEVAVIGAGCAGIAAARALRAAGRSCVVLEAAPRIGGRAFTESASLGAPFDHGATWLHQAAENPLRPFAPDAPDHDTVRERCLWLGDRWATPDELRDQERAFDAFEAAVERAAAGGGPDRAVAEVAPRGGRWDATIAHWLGAQINAASLDAISLEDFVRTDLTGPNLLPREGVGGVVARLAEGLPIMTGARVEALRWDGPGVVLEGRFGTLRARSAIVTVSNGVLAAGGIRFAPGLPAATQAAIHGLPMGLLTKIGFRARGTDRLGIAPFHSARRAVGPGAPHPFGWVFWPHARDHLFGFVGGARAWSLAREGAAATEDAAREDLRAMFGARADAALAACVVTGWGTDPLHLGSYTHARPGHHASRAVLSAPLAGGRLLFAGEACHRRFAGTVAGAWLSGEAAARLAA
ncbi:MAG: FAD-dependent oxidoreductase [Acetobacteraceae bacterium]|nr:FAD-dependent oxidoreductase [Acetobacteraceae bacterium]